MGPPPLHRSDRACRYLRLALPSQPHSFPYAGSGRIWRGARDYRCARPDRAGDGCRARPVRDDRGDGAFAVNLPCGVSLQSVARRRDHHPDRAGDGRHIRAKSGLAELRGSRGPFRHRRFWTPRRQAGAANACLRPGGLFKTGREHRRCCRAVSGRCPVPRPSCDRSKLSRGMERLCRRFPSAIADPIHMEPQPSSDGKDRLFQSAAHDQRHWPRLY